VVKNHLILVTGVTGYVGRSLVPHLIHKGYQVRCLVRNPSRLKNWEYFPMVEVVEGDLLELKSLERAMKDVQTIYYLVHSMKSGENYIERDIVAAQNVSLIASKAGVQHILYLGGLANPEDDIGPHMLSRIQTGEALRQGKVPVTEFRASMVIGSGSISFEMIRFLTEQLPLLIGPSWFRNLAQPIAIQDVIEYLLASLENADTRGHIYEIGGKDVLSYAETMLTYAKCRGYNRTLVTLPLVPIKMMAYFVEKMTPVPRRIAGPLIGGMQSNSLVRDHTASRVFPHIVPISFCDAVSAAFNQLSPEKIERVWDETSPLVRMKHQGFFIEHRHLMLNTPPEHIYDTFSNLGGKQDWLYLNNLWKFRGLIDKLVGGPGNRGRNNSGNLKEGDIIDYYQVDKVIPGQMVRLKAELRAPGDGWMEWSVIGSKLGKSILSQTAYFAPRGPSGFLYWYLLAPLHRLVFAGLIQRIGTVACEQSDQVK